MESPAACGIAAYSSLSIVLHFARGTRFRAREAQELLIRRLNLVAYEEVGKSWIVGCFKIWFETGNRVRRSNLCGLLISGRLAAGCDACFLHRT